MTPEEYRRARVVFHDVADLSDTERLAYLDEKCADDPEVRREVERLLAVEAADPILRTSSMAERADAPDPNPPASPRGPASETTGWFAASASAAWARSTRRCRTIRGAPSP